MEFELPDQPQGGDDSVEQDGEVKKSTQHRAGPDRAVHIPEQEDG